MGCHYQPSSSSGRHDQLLGGASHHLLLRQQLCWGPPGLVTAGDDERCCLPAWPLLHQPDCLSLTTCRDPAPSTCTQLLLLHYPNVLTPNVDCLAHHHLLWAAHFHLLPLHLPTCCLLHSHLFGHLLLCLLTLDRIRT